MNSARYIFVRHGQRHLVATAALQWFAVFLLRFTFEEDSTNEGLCKSKRNAELTAELLHAVALATALSEGHNVRIDVVLYASASYLLYAADVCGSERLSCGTLGTEFAFSYMDVPEGLLVLADLSRVLPVVLLAARFSLRLQDQGKVILLWALTAVVAIVLRADYEDTDVWSNVWTLGWRALEIAIVYAPFAARNSENAEKDSNEADEPTTSKEAKSL